MKRSLKLVGRISRTDYESEGCRFDSGRVYFLWGDRPPLRHRAGPLGTLAACCENKAAMPTRSNACVASYQIEGLCQSLRPLVLNGLDPGVEARHALRKLRDGWVGSGSGMTVELIPEVTDESSPADLLVTAELLRVSMIAFLTPEEAEEQRGFFGFRNPGGA
jgi:hypothetical protein